MLDIQYKILDPRAADYLPKYATNHSSGLDLHALLDDEVVLAAGQSLLISTGLAIFIANPAYMGLIFPRSGLGHKHGVILGNGTGVIDADYQGELKVSLWNRSSQNYMIKPFERIAQLVITPVMHAKFTAVDAFEATNRGTGGFGSTGQ
jgi:dUTP pyrophosphatase